MLKDGSETIININPDAETNAEEVEGIGADLLLAAQYCYRKAAAMRARISGDITGALAHEEICDAVYRMFPERLKSW